MIALKFDRDRTLELFSGTKQESYALLDFSEQVKSQHKNWDFKHYLLKEKNELKGHVLISGEVLTYLEILNGADWQSEILLIVHHFELAPWNPNWYKVGLHWPTWKCLFNLKKYTTGVEYIASPEPLSPFIRLSSKIEGYDAIKEKDPDLLIFFLLQDNEAAFSSIFSNGFTADEVLSSNQGRRSLVESAFFFQSPKVASFLLKQSPITAKEKIDLLTRLVVQNESLTMLDVLKAYFAPSVVEDSLKKNLKFCLVNGLVNFEFVTSQVKSYNLKMEEIRLLVFKNEVTRLRFLFEKYSIDHTASLSYMLREASSAEMGQLLEEYHAKRNSAVRLQDVMLSKKLAREAKDD